MDFVKARTPANSAALSFKSLASIMMCALVVSDSQTLLLQPSSRVVNTEIFGSSWRSSCGSKEPDDVTVVLQQSGTPCDTNKRPQLWLPQNVATWLEEREPLMVRTSRPPALNLHLIDFIVGTFLEDTVNSHVSLFTKGFDGQQQQEKGRGIGGVPAESPEGSNGESH